MKEGYGGSKEDINKGTHAVIIDFEGEPEKNISRHSVTPQYDDMCSLVTEQYGLLALLILIYQAFSGVSDEALQGLSKGNKIEVLIDNLEVVSRNKRGFQGVSLSDYNKMHYDIWRVIERLKETIPISVVVTKIEAHQNRDDKGQIHYGPYDRTVRLNIEADYEAEMGYTDMRILAPIRTEYGAIYFGDKYFGTTKFKDLIQRQYWKEDLLQYYERKRGWSSEYIKKINWNAIQQLLDGKTLCRRLNYLKYIHNWQYVGRRIGHIEDGCTLCINNCGEHEGYLHYLACSKLRMNVLVIRQRFRVRRRLDYIYTSPIIVDIIMDILENYGTNKMFAQFFTQDRLVLQVIYEQTILGWQAFLQGYHHHLWESLQRRYLTTVQPVDNKLNAKQWSSKCIQILFDYAEEVWKVRNINLHGVHGITTRRLKLQQIKEKVIALYQIPRVGASEATNYMFKIPLEKRLKRGITYLQEWYALTTKIIAEDRELQGPRQLTLQEAWALQRQVHTDVNIYQDTIKGTQL